MLKHYEIPDVRDGLTPLQRRILWTMKSMGLHSKKLGTKAIKVVSEVGKGETEGFKDYRPSPVCWVSDYVSSNTNSTIYYETMVPMAQEWRHQLPLIACHGNWGSITGEYAAAACCYTDCNISDFTEKALLAGINQKAVRFVSNPNAIKGKEPSVLPARIPNALITGTSGNSHIPPHNLGEVIDAVIAMIQNPNLKPEQLFEYIKGPDFATGGIIINKSELQEIYQTGVGEIRIQATLKAETLSDGENQIIVKEFPYTMIGKIRNFVENVKYMKRIGFLPDITNVETMKTRTCPNIFVGITLKSTTDIQRYMELLYEYSDLKGSFDYRAILTSNGKPCIMSLHRIISEWLEFYRETRTRQNHGVALTNDEMIADLQKIRKQFATPRKTVIIDAM
ncbi:MAG: DNA gyrase subunit A [Oscillospiraceae bacterium]|nr:DNA gyrase subunit A [Oscillospiraceae bacterium]